MTKLKSLLLPLGLAFAALCASAQTQTIPLAWDWTNGLPDQPLSFQISASTNLSAPLSAWMPLTNVVCPVLSTNVTTNAVNGIVLTNYTVQVVTQTVVQVTGPAPWFLIAQTVSAGGVSPPSNAAEWPGPPGPPSNFKVKK